MRRPILMREAEVVIKQEDIIKESLLKQDLRHDDMEMRPGSYGNVVMYEEDTRMSADTTHSSSRGQTPAKQLVSTSDLNLQDESQSSVQSTATIESITTTPTRGGSIVSSSTGDKEKGGRKKTRGEVVQDPKSNILTPDQLAEYYWGEDQISYMLQEQVALYLGIKSFKRKYPGISRRPVDMQERDYIRDNGLASEHMCNLGLTAVLTADILDIMYLDFPIKYEEYCKYQRDKQMKEISNKQKILTKIQQQELNKKDMLQQAIESAAQWNANFNKTRREQRKSCMDLQTFTVNYPKEKMKSIDRPSVGTYPIALVPGQYTDYYKIYSSAELKRFPINTTLYSPCDDDDTSDSDSDSDSSSSDGGGNKSGSDGGSSGPDSGPDSSDDDGTECNLCKRSSTAGTSPKSVT